MALAILAACGGSTRRPTIDVTPVNALVPVELRSELVFESRELPVELGDATTRYTMAVPTKFLIMPWVKPDPSRQLVVLGDLDQGKLTVGAVCDGACGLRDWKATIDELSFAPIRAVKAVEIVADQTTLDRATGFQRRSMIAKHSEPTPTTIVSQAIWIDGGDRYWLCEVQLHGTLQAAAAAFAKACETVQRSGDGAMPIMSTAKPPPNFIAVPSHPGIEILVPPALTPFVLQGGLSGFEGSDGMQFTIERADDGLIDVAAFKGSWSQAAWLSEREIDGGWMVTFKVDPLTAGDPDHGVQVRRKLGDTVYKCGAIVKQQHLQAVLAACTSLKLEAR